jgi:phage baseplate assembly protein W
MRKTINIEYPFVNSPNNHFFKMTQTSNEALISNLNYYITVKKGERLYKPNFGFGLDRYLFEPLTDTLLKNMENELREDIKTNFPDISIKSIESITNPDRYLISIIMTLLINGEEIENQITI